MKKAIINISIFFIVTSSLLYLLQYIVETGLRKSESDTYIDWNRIYQSKINADLIIMGPSRACLMISPKILDSDLHVNSYNLGLDAWTFGMQYARFKIYMQRNTKPKYVLQSVDLNIFNERKDLVEYGQFLPYLFDTIIVNTANQYIGKFTFPEIYFPMFKYNNDFDAIKEGILSFFGKTKKGLKYKGFYFNDMKWDNDLFLQRMKEHPNGVSDTIIEKTKQKMIEYIKYCNKSNIKLIFEFAPIYHYGIGLLAHNNRQEIIDLIKQLANENNIPFLDYSNDSLCYSTEYFYNSTHLNKKGVEIFNNKLANDLKSYIH